MLLQQDPDKVPNTADFKDALHLYYDKQTVISFNTQQLLTLNKPIAMVKTIHNCATAASAKPNDTGGLYPILFVAEGANVMLTANLWQQVGFCNGAAGTIHSILYGQNQSPPDLPIAIIEQYTGPPFISTHPTATPIPPITFEWEAGDTKLSRQRIPIQL